MKDALLEIGLEHLPARFVAPALSQLAARVEALLREHRLKAAGVTAEGTLRRLAVVVRGVEDQSQALETVVAGPPARLWKDEQGRFTPQSAGFAKSQGVRPEDLETVRTPKGEFLQARKTVPGEPAAEALAKVFPAAVRGLEFPKNMVWEPSRLRFARPIRGLLALYGAKVIPFSIAGVRSGGGALGPGVLSGPVKIGKPAEYVAELRDHGVLVRPEDRKAALSRALDQSAAGLDGRIDRDPALLEEIVYLTEYPSAVPGRFDAVFLRLPQALLTTVLKKQLKFFPVLAASGGLAPRFVGVRDGAAEDLKEVREGYERVLEARFDDAKFFHERDTKTRLRDKQELLQGLAFHRGLGSMYEKRERVVELAIWLCSALWRRGTTFNLGAVEAIARLAYADLVTDVVREFPELQAVIGAYYARRDGEDERVAVGVEEFYLPTSARGPLPSHYEGAVVSLAAKMDTLAALLIAGVKPSGSEDPFGLRRAGTGIVRIVLEKQLPLNLHQFAAKARALVLEKGLQDPRRAPSAAEVETAVRDFLWTRAENCFADMGYSPDEIQAVAEDGLGDLVRTFKRLNAVHALRPNPDFAQLAAAFKRAANILKQAGVDVAESPSVSRTLISHEAETTLYEAMMRVEKTVLERISREDYENGLKRLVELKPCVDHFFETVRVMDAAEQVRRNRLALLATLVRLFKSVADFSCIQSTN